MRERLAKAVAALFTGMVVLLAAYFADRRNEPERAAVTEVPSLPAQPAPTSPPDPTLVARGRDVYDGQACARCHALEGGGNPRSPLDGVGARRSASDLRAWVTGSGPAREELTRSTLRTKRGFAELPEAQIEALVAFLSSLR